MYKRKTRFTSTFSKDCRTKFSYIGTRRNIDALIDNNRYYNERNKMVFNKF